MMSSGDYMRPVRPPRGAKTSKETTGTFMSIINDLTKSQDNAERDKEKKKLEKEFNDCDRKLNHLVEDHREDLSEIMKVFSKVHVNVEISQSKCNEINEMLTRCKKLLHCKRDELKRLWLQVVEHKRVLCMLKEIETVISSQEKIEAFLKNKMYIEATELMVSSKSLLERSLSDVDALKELKAELNGKQENLHSIIVQELHILLYTTSTSHVLNCFKRIGSGRMRSEKQKVWAHTKDLYENATTVTSMKTASSDTCLDNENLHNLENSTKMTINNLVDCVACLHRIPETIEVLEERCEQELLAIVHRTAKHVAESVQSITTTYGQKSLRSMLNKDQENLLLDLFALVFEQFKCVSECHKELLKKLYHKAANKKAGNLETEHKYEMADVWSKMQTVLEIFIGEYVDLNNFATPHPAVPSSFTNVPSAVDMNSFFLRRKLQKPKNYALFKFDSSSHALSMKTYLQEQKEALKGKGEMDSFDSETHILVCPPCNKNITTIFIPTSKFITEMEEDLKLQISNRGTGPLRTFISSCVKAFREQASLEVVELSLNSAKSMQNWRVNTDEQIIISNNEKKHLLHGAICVDRLLTELKDLILALPKHAAHFLSEACSVLMTYRKACQTEYSSLIQPHSEDKQIISSNWAKDEDISRLLKSLPNYENLSEIEPSELQESPEEIRLRNKKESEILMTNLSGDTLIFSHEILTDPHHLHNLGLLHESLDWLQHRIMNFASSIPNVSFEAITSGEIDEDERCVIPPDLMDTLEQMKKEYVNLADTCLLVLHLEVRVHCFYYLQPLASQSSHATRLDIQEPDPEVQKLNSDIAKIDELLQSVLKSSNIKYIFEGLGDLIATILINSAGKIKRINENGVKKMIRNIFALQQNLTGITMSREVALDRARQYYDLLNHSPEEVLNLIVENGPQFQELEYSAVFCLWHRSHPCTNANASLSNYLERLHQILNEVAVSV